MRNAPIAENGQLRESRATMASFLIIIGSLASPEGKTARNTTKATECLCGTCIAGRSLDTHVPWLFAGSGGGSCQPDRGHST
eukprot:1789703-Rhodomonas_salina.2